MRYRLLAVILALLLSLPFAAEPAESEEREQEMTTYQLVLLRANPEFARDGSVGSRLADHREDRYKMANELYLRSLVDAEWAVVAGPIEGHESIRYVAIMQVPSEHEPEFAFQENPAVQSGRLEVEIYTVHVPAGLLRFPEDTASTRNAHLGLLMRSKDRPKLSDDRLEEIRQARVEHNEEKVASGLFVLEGEVDGGGDLRAIMIFRERKEGPIRKLVAADPGIENGLLELELYRWRVPKRNWARKSFQLGNQPWP